MSMAPRTLGTLLALWGALCPCSPSLSEPLASEASPIETPEPSPSARALEPLERQQEPWLQQWLGGPDWLSITASYVNEINGNPFGGFSQRATYTHNLGLETTWSRGVTRPVIEWDEFDHWSLRANLSQRSGVSLSQSIPNALAVQQIYGYGQTFRLAGLWVERQQQEPGLLMLKAGKLATFDDFASSPLYCYYTNNGFCGQTWGVPNSLPVAAYPANQYGAVMHLGTATGARLRYGVYQINPDGFEPGYHGADFEINAATDGVAQFLQIDVPFATPAPQFFRVDRSGQMLVVPEDEADLVYRSGLPQPGLQFGGWLGRWSFPLLDQSGRTSRDNNGIYGLVSVPLNPGGLVLDGRLWANGSLGFNPEVQTIPAFVAGGWVGKGLFAGRPNDALVLGFSRATWSDDLNTAQGWESVLELGYQVAIGTNATLQPNLQWVFNPSGTGEVPDAWVVGLQMTLLF